MVFKRYFIRNEKNEFLEYIICKCINRINLIFGNVLRRKGNFKVRIGRIIVMEDEI